jgi:hypothetical protein
MDMSDNVTPPISPELALVDPDLAVAARALLPEPADCLAARLRVPVRLPAQRHDAVPVAPARSTTELRRPRDLRRALRGVVTVGGWVALAGIIASPLLAFLPPNGAPSIVDALRAPLPATAAPNGAEPRSTIRWRPVPGASFYNLILVRGSRRVDFWPTKPTARVTRSQRAGTPATPVVTYAWFVYPAFRSAPGKVRYGTVVDHGSIAVRSGTLRAGT